ncbi:MAG: hypothetical protein ACI8RA_001701 [Chlamydiales bacterium]
MCKNKVSLLSSSCAADARRKFAAEVGISARIYNAADGLQDELKRGALFLHSS